MNKGAFFNNFNPTVDQRELEEVREYLTTDQAIEEYQAEMDGNRKIVVKIVLKKFSYQAAEQSFLGLSDFMRRSYFNVYACEEYEECVRYRFCTGLEEEDGIKMGVIIG